TKVPLLILGSLPDSLETLALKGTIIDQLQPSLLPSSLTNLKLDHLLNPPKPGDLPSSITSLKFGKHFNLELGVDVLPRSLQTLTFGKKFNQPLSPGVLPRSLQSLYFVKDGEFNQPLELDVLPPQLSKLSLLSRRNQDFRVHSSFWPPSLQTLVVGNLWNYSPHHGHLPLPPSVTSLSIQLELPITSGAFPSTLVHLTIGNAFNQLLQVGALPSSLVKLSFGDAFNQPLPTGVLPSSLVHLSFGDSFNQPLPTGVLPPSLSYLSLGREFNQGLKQTSLPRSLQILSVNTLRQTKYVTLPKSFKSDLELLEVRSTFVWTNMVPKNKMRSIKLLRIKQFEKRSSCSDSQSSIIGPMLVSLPNVHTFDIEFYEQPRKGEFEGDILKVQYRIQVRRINERLAIGLFSYTPNSWPIRCLPIH
ncbi:hypothetical protein SAMD00019534_115010, partial [Acytostelium subglobosum LB1]|uniref:hypothetical protein n=1 Tax=Acytostelium subglobosum LB1 TaxID=1410327 RepID=UPI0006450434